MAHSTGSTARPKPAKPRADFPLSPHATGRRAKKVRGRFHYFGKIADVPKGEAALNFWLDQKDDLLAGRLPRTAKGGLTVRDLTCYPKTSPSVRRIWRRDLARRFLEDWP